MPAVALRASRSLEAASTGATTRRAAGTAATLTSTALARAGGAGRAAPRPAARAKRWVSGAGQECHEWHQAGTLLRGLRASLRNLPRHRVAGPVEGTRRGA